MRIKKQVPLNKALEYKLRAIFNPKNITQPDQANFAEGRFFSFGDQGWRLNQKESQHLERTVKILHSHFPKVHPKTCRRYLQKFCCEEFPKNYDTFHERLPALLEGIAEQEKNQAVVAIEVAGLQLDMESFRFGDFEFIDSANTSLTNLKNEIRNKDGCLPDALPNGCVLAKIELRGDPEFANETARAELQRTIDVLQFISAKINPKVPDCEILGFSLYIGEPRAPASARAWAYNTTPNPSWSQNNSNSEIPNNNLQKFSLSINSKKIQTLQEYGWHQFDELLKKPQPSYFEQNLLSAITWFARAVRDVDPARKFVDLFISLETLFSNDKENPEKAKHGAFNIREGVAYLLGNDVDKRLKIKGYVDNLAKTRNKVVHSGYSQIEEGDLNLLFGLVFSSILKSLKLADQFKEPCSFSKWAKRIKLGESMKLVEYAAETSYSNSKESKTHE